MMKRYLQTLLLIAVAAVSLYAQTPVSSLPYFCGFEDVLENANWTLNRRGGFSTTPLPSNWTIGTGAKHSGINGLYIYTTANGSDASTAQYDGSNAVFTVAERHFSLPVGTYDLAFDWRCLGDSINDAIFVYWVPASTTMTGRTTSTLPTNATPLTINGLTYLSGAATWSQARVTVTTSSSQNYKLVFVWRNNTTNTYNPSGCIDNVQLQVHETATDCWKSVSNLKWQQGATADVLSWSGNNGATYDIFYWLEGSIQVDSVIGVTGNSHTFSHGDLASGLYTFAVRTNCGDEQSILVECINAKSLGDYSTVAEACPEVDLNASEIIDGAKYLVPACDNDGTYTIKPNVVAGGGSIAGYRVDKVSYSECPFPFDLNQLPPQYRNKITTITQDDYWDTKLIDLPFTVCFFDGVYRQALVGANGLVSFDPAIRPNSRCEWNLQNQPDIPNTDFIYKNCIMGVFQDYYPPAMGTTGQIWYGVLGEWPCRKMVICWNEVPMFANHSTINSSMIVMYEGTNVIDVYVKNRDLSPTGWNDNRGIIGIINADGTEGVAAPGRNTTDGDNKGKGWSAKNEAWRFTPYSTPTYMLTWYKGVFTTPAAIDAYILEHPQEEIEMSVADSIVLYDGGDVDEVTVRLQYSQCNGDYIDIVDYAYVNWPRTDTIRVDTFFCEGKAYSDKYVHRADTAGIYRVGIRNVHGCDSVVYLLDLAMKEKTQIERYDTICYGESLEVGGVTLGMAGDWPVTFKYADCNCDSVNVMVHLDVMDLTNFDVQEPTGICADDEQFVLGLSASTSKIVYSIIFDSIAHQQGFADVLNDTVYDVSEIIIDMPEGVRPDKYTALLRLVSTGCGGLEQNISIPVSYPSSITPIKWNNVIPVLDTPYNGGYVFSDFQWYKNGEPLEYETGPYYHVTEGLEEGAYYQVALTRQGESYAILTCPVYYGVTDLEDLVINNGEGGIKTEAEKVIRNGHLYIIKDKKEYTVLGTRVL